MSDDTNRRLRVNRKLAGCELKKVLAFPGTIIIFLPSNISIRSLFQPVGAQTLNLFSRLFEAQRLIE
jgi:hypothetical protein